jgi:DNA-binding LacI/PurR family transcriptional regulator
VKSKKTEKLRLGGGPIGLKQLAEYLGLNPATVSVVLNDTPGRAIPQATRDRIKAAAKELNYQPNLLARSLRNRRTQTIGILIPELGDGYHTEVIGGINDHLMEASYFYLTAHHRHRKHLVEEYAEMLIHRGADALIAVDTALEHSYSVPVVAIAGHRPIDGVTNVLLDHRFAAELTLRHLYALGHRQIAFMRGQSFSSDSDERWKNLVQVAHETGIKIDPALILQLDRDVNSPELGYPAMQRLLLSGVGGFTAVVCFNDMSAIGAIRAMEDFNMRVPEDVSVIGFDDIRTAAFHSPRLTTIRQPLANMGRIAAQCILNRLHGTERFREKIIVEPELIVRESTRAVSKSTRNPKINTLGRPGR